MEGAKAHSECDTGGVRSIGMGIASRLGGSGSGEGGSSSAEPKSGILGNLNFQLDHNNQTAKLNLTSITTATINLALIRPIPTRPTAHTSAEPDPVGHVRLGPGPVAHLVRFPIARANTNNQLTPRLASSQS